MWNLMCLLDIKGDMSNSQWVIQAKDMGYWSWSVAFRKSDNMVLFSQDSPGLYLLSQYYC